ncbi:MAG: glutamate 5-kinase [Acidiferrobacterales bacterium]
MSQPFKSNRRESLTEVRRCVVKIGSALLAGDGDSLDVNAIGEWVGQMAALRQQGMEVLLVTSGSVAVGMKRLNHRQRPRALNELQAMAAIGQMGLIQAYEAAFQKFDMHTAQVLLTHDDLADRSRYLNARTTLLTLLKLGVVPVINENDTVAVEEIRFGDNDTLAAQVVNLIEADLLIILTDQAGLYSADPRSNESARLIPEGQAGDASLESFAGDPGGSGALGRGGMRTKLAAAKKAARSGAATIIASGHEKDVLNRVLAGESIGTCLSAGQGRLTSRKQWLAGHLDPRGILHLDSGAVSVLCNRGSSLLAVGVVRVEGQFSRGELVSCFDPDGNEIARGLVNYSSQDTQKILGAASEDIESILGYVDEPELVHRDNMVVL